LTQSFQLFLFPGAVKNRFLSLYFKFCHVFGNRHTFFKQFYNLVINDIDFFSHFL